MCVCFFVVIHFLFLIFKTKIHSKCSWICVVSVQWQRHYFWSLANHFRSYFSIGLTKMFTSINHLFNRYTHTPKIVCVVSPINFKRKWSTHSVWVVILFMFGYYQLNADKNKIELSSYFTHWTSKTAAAVAVTATTKHTIQMLCR